MYNPIAEAWFRVRVWWMGRKLRKDRERLERITLQKLKEEERLADLRAQSPLLKTVVKEFEDRKQGLLVLFPLLVSGLLAGCLCGCSVERAQGGGPSLWGVEPAPAAQPAPALQQPFQQPAPAVQVLPALPACRTVSGSASCAPPPPPPPNWDRRAPGAAQPVLHPVLNPGQRGFRGYLPPAAGPAARPAEELSAGRRVEPAAPAPVPCPVPLEHDPCPGGCCEIPLAP